MECVTDAGGVLSPIPVVEGNQDMKDVLFVCTQNAGRSQMAEALFSRMSPSDVRAESAGQEPRTEGLWPAVIEVMAEIGIDLSQKRSRRLLPEMQLHADWAITLACGATCPYVPTSVEDWDIPDPAGKTVDEVRAIRDQIGLRVLDLIDKRIDAIRTDRTAHELRLTRLLPHLIERFPDLPDSEVRSCADTVLAEYIDAPVRSFVANLAERKARECLATGACREPAAT
jgi:arsenate reductase